MKMDFPSYLDKVKFLLVSIGYAQTTVLDPEPWRDLYESDHNPFEAIKEMEYDGQLTWGEFREMQLKNGYEDPYQLKTQL